MNSMLKRSLVVAGAVLALGQGAARAADFRDMTVNVPFPFLIKDKLMPAGKYEVQRDDQDQSLMLIRNESGRHVGSFVLTEHAGGQDPSGNKPCLFFKRDGNRYQLSSVWESSDDGVVLTGRK